MWTASDIKELASEFLTNPRFARYLVVKTVTNTVEAGSDAPRRWYVF